METGYIRIINGIVKFEYHELKEPYWFCECIICKKTLSKWLKKYEASKRTVEVSNVSFSIGNKYWFFIGGIHEIVGKKVSNDQLCKAEIKNNKATIIEIES